MTTPNNSHTGNVGIIGDININGRIGHGPDKYIDKDGRHFAIAGTLARPGYSFNGAEDTGLYLNSDGDLELVAGGVSALSVSSTGNASGVGTVGSSAVVPVESGDAATHVTDLTITNLTLGQVANGGETLAFGGLLYTFPAGTIVVKTIHFNIGLSSPDSAGMNADTPDVGVGTLVGSGANATLNLVGAAAENILTGQTFADVTGTATDVLSPLAGAGPILNIESGDAHVVYLNAADAWADPGTGNPGTVVANGTVSIEWVKLA